ncbi:hypothetical protein Acr_24g0004970 [Actinidia rufa]|uniref:Uncharacterized protein n=1 Tax=Actinidia rufa TaxID=165716 RepID=A0A7J0GTY5_9ERIC|nr:hypothetical protein Acr_24g0004970 [Actinidia rufa]
MSKEEDVDERQYLYVRKYHKMVKQSPRKSRSTSAGGGGSHIAPPPDGISNGRASTAAARGRSNSKPASMSQLNNNSILVETITRHLQDLKNENPSDSDCFNPATK